VNKIKSDNIKQIFIKFDNNKHSFLFLFGSSGPVFVEMITVITISGAHCIYILGIVNLSSPRWLLKVNLRRRFAFQNNII
jgi:hypothetical protein